MLGLLPGFVDNTDIFRLTSLNLSDGSLAGIGSAVDISSLVGPAPFSFGMIEADDIIYAGFVDQNR